MMGQTGDIIKKAAKAAGVSESQARSMARERGMSDADIKAEAAKRGLIPNESGESTSNPSTLIEPVEKLTDPITDEKTLEIDPLDESDVEAGREPQPGKVGLPYFGYDIFKADPSAFQASTFGAIDPKYNIGPGDEIIIMLWGETQFRQTFNVDREGYIFIPDIGQVFVNGLNLEKLEKKLFKRLSKVYSSLKSSGGRATSFLDVSLGELRPLRIMVLGDVAQPGAYAVSPTTTLFTALYYFRGPTKSGSLRDIQLIRNGKKIASIDFYTYLLSGKTVGDERLQLDDVIFIPKRGKTVSIQGEVKQSAIYEIKNDESIGDLLTMAGGLKNTAYLDRAQIDRIVPFEERTDYWNDRVLEDFNLGQIMKDDRLLKMRDGDAIQIFSILDMHRNDVYITGSAVSRPGRFELSRGMKVSDLIDEAGGLLSNAFLGKAHITRTKQDDLRKELISINLEEALDGNPKHNIELHWMDQLSTFSISEMVPQYGISLKGHVKNAGDYLLIENTTLYDILFQYGGFMDPEWRNRTFMGRADLSRLDEDRITRTNTPFNLDNVLNNPAGNQNVELKPGDVITVYPKTVFNAGKPVTIQGVVKTPGRYTLKSNMVLKDLILEAGGLNTNVYRYKVEVARIDPENDSFEEYAEVITFNMNEQFIVSEIDNKGNASGLTDATDAFKLNPYDIITIRPDPFFSAQRMVKVSGMVMYPGDYTILSPHETIKDIIDRAGGVRPEAYLEASQYKRAGQTIKISLEDVVNNKKSKLNFDVQSGDEIIIVPKPNVVSIFGEVNNPGFRKYISGKNMGYYIKISGGYNIDADRNNVWVSYPNGDSKKWKKYSPFSPKILDGSIVTVGKKPEEEPLDKTEFAKELASIFADFAQVIALIFVANK